MIGMVTPRRRKNCGKRPVVLEVKRAPEKIIRQLDRLRWNQKRLSVETGIQESRISRWLDKDGNPKPLQFLAIARALSVTVDYLIDDHQDAMSPMLSSEENYILETVRKLGYEVAVQRLLATSADASQTGTREAQQGQVPETTARGQGPARLIPPPRPMAMYLVRVGNLTISLEHLILVEDAQGEPEPRTLPDGVYRLTMETGRVFDLTGERAECARKLIDEVVIRNGGKVRDANVGREAKPPTSPEPPAPPPADYSESNGLPPRE
jgi:transcriptional regulator with XRE-family HTH domain